MKNTLGTILLGAALSFNLAASQNSGKLEQRTQSDTLNFSEKSKKSLLLASELEDIYLSHNVDRLKMFFDKWSEIPSNSDSLANQNDTLKAIVQMYTELYNPFDLDKVGGSEFGNLYTYEGSKFIAVRNKMWYRVAKTDREYGKEMWQSLSLDSIADFRPKIDIPGVKTLYANKDYTEAIELFLGDESSEVGSDGNPMSVSHAKGESKNRQKFINGMLPIIHGHWGGWIIETQPDIYFVHFNKAFNKASAHYNTLFEGGEAKYERKNGEWKYKSAARTSIQ